MKWKAVKTSAALSLLFVIVYGTTNWVTSLRHGVRNLYFPWERHIPFLPWMIVPYMSIDLFFISSPFLCRSDQERRTLSRRIAASILIGGICFLLFPLRFSFERPHVEGWLGAIFNNFRKMDQPFNEFPSLHIALCMILADHYARHTKGILRVGLFIWFGLIAVSAVVTYQHHVVDVIGGLALAVLCLHLIQNEPLRQPSTGNRRVGGYYLIGSLLLMIGGCSAGPWSWILFWPAVSLGLIATAYLGIGPGIFRKRGGRLPITTRIIFWPVLLGHRISLAYYARQCQPWDRLTDRLWIGRRLCSRDAQCIIATGVIAVLDLTAEFSENPRLLGIAYRQIPILDLTAPTGEQLREALVWITEQAATGIVYVHCKAGYSRTGAIAGAFLMASGQAESAEVVMEMLRAARPSIIIRPEAAQVFREFQADSSAICGVPSPIPPGS